MFKAGPAMHRHDVIELHPVEKRISLTCSLSPNMFVVLIQPRNLVRHTHAHTTPFPAVITNRTIKVCVRQMYAVSANYINAH